MIHFQCPHCRNDFHDDDLFSQETPFFEVNDATLQAHCDNCLENFKVRRTLELKFEVLNHEE